MSEETTQPAVLACPKCGKTDIAEHAHWAEPVVLIVLLVVLYGLASLAKGMVGIYVFLAFKVSLFLVASASASSALFGSHKCRACGEKWR